ncbi:hypothetical protein vseg_004477 [Gypsophila vaccaria]
MDAVSSTGCILLVDANLASLARTALLLRSKYEVVTAINGVNAISILMEHNGITLMIVDHDLPDVSSFELVKFVEQTTKLPIVMMCDTTKTSTDARLSGAMVGFLKPLHPEIIEHLWKLPSLKRRQMMYNSNQPQMLRILNEQPVAQIPSTPDVGNYYCSQSSNLQTNDHMMPESSNSFQNYKKRKMDEMQRGHDWSMGQNSPIVLTPDLNCKFMKVALNLGISSADASAVSCHVDVSRATERSQPLHLYSRLLQELCARIIYAASANSLNTPLMMDPYMGQSIPNNHQLMHKQEQYSPLIMFMQDPHCRAQLKRIVQGSLLNWAAEHGAYSNVDTSVSGVNLGPAQGIPHQPSIPGLNAMWNVSPPPSATAFAGQSIMPPMSVMVALVREIEKFIYSILNASNAQQGFMAAIPELLSGGQESGPGFLGKFNAVDMCDAIIKLLND